LLDNATAAREGLTVNHFLVLIIVALGLTSGVSMAYTNKGTVPAGSASERVTAPYPAPKPAQMNVLAQCYALDVVARHECIYAALPRGREAGQKTLN
jgi:hypothetical protein